MELCSMELYINCKEMTKKIKLTRSKFTLVDDDVYEYLKWFKWTFLFVGKGYEGYAVHYRRGADKKVTQIQLHTIINKTPKGMETDHINGNSLDNRRCNLRTVTHQQNLQNSRKKCITRSKYKGVAPARKKWRAQIASNNKTYYLGVFNTEEQAAIAYNAEAIKLHGKYAFVNVL